MMQSFVSASLLVVAQAFNPGIQIVSPTEGQVFAPGDTVTIQADITDPDLIGGVFASVFGAILDKIDPPYEMTVTVPDPASGTYSVKAKTYDLAQVLQIAQPVNIIVRRSTPPDELSAEPSAWVRLPAAPNASPQRISVQGVFGDVEVDLNPFVTGTTYTSSDTSIVTVDTEGVLTGMSDGRAVVTVENLGVKAFTIVRVSDPSGILSGDPGLSFASFRTGSVTDQ